MFKGKNISKVQIAIFVFLLTLFILFISYRQFKDGIVLWGDGFFHAQRILEMRYAFAHRELPNWLNFQTFFGMGQAINGMYPDISLWPFVLLTMFLSPSHQVAAINILIFFLTLIITAISLQKRIHISHLSAVYAATLYSCSGYSLYEVLREFQPGVGLIFAFSFPIIFLIKDLLESSHFNLKLAIWFTLTITLIIYSHLLSIIVLGIIIISGYIYLVITKNFNWHSLINAFLGGLMSIFTTLPILYRYFVISSSNIMSPFGQGNIKTGSIINMVKGTSWDARATIPSLVLIICLIIFAFWNKQSSSKLLKLGIIELYLILLCTNIFPWKLFNHVPFVNNLQYTPWRFGIWLSIIPIIALIVCFRKNMKIGYKVLYVLAIISIVMSFVIAHNTFINCPTKLTSNNTKIMTTVQSNYNTRETSILNWAEKPDYFPKVNDVADSKENMTNSRLDEIQHQFVKTENGKIKITKYSINNGVAIIPKQSLNSSDEEIRLPILGYNSLEYNIVSSQHNNLKYGIDKEGYLFVKMKRLQKGKSIKVKFNNPVAYKMLVVISLFVLLCLLLVINFSKIKENYVKKAI